jgi:hypothetical protein
VDTTGVVAKSFHEKRHHIHRDHGPDVLYSHFHAHSRCHLVPETGLLKIGFIWSNQEERISQIVGLAESFTEYVKLFSNFR